MKTTLALLALAATLVAGNSQQITNTPPVLASPVLTFLTQGTNYEFATYGMYDTTDKTWGGGIALALVTSDYFMPVMRLDWVHGEAFAPSGSVQLQAPFMISGKVKVTPFIFTGVGTSFGDSNATDGNAIGIFGAGAAISTGKKGWWPKHLLFDYERWTGGGFNDNQWRLGLGW